MFQRETMPTQSYQGAYDGRTAVRSCRDGDIYSSPVACADGTGRPGEPSVAFIQPGTCPRTPSPCRDASQRTSLTPPPAPRSSRVRSRADFAHADEQVRDECVSCRSVYLPFPAGKIWRRTYAADTTAPPRHSRGRTTPHVAETPHPHPTPVLTCLP